MTRITDSSSVGSTTRSLYGYVRERSDSRELPSSPLTSSPITLGSRGELRSEVMRSRSSSSTDPNVGLGTTSTSSTTSAPSSTLGYRSRQSTSATPNNSFVSKLCKNEGDLIMDRDVENNYDSSSCPALDRSASLSNTDEVVSLHMNGNDT
ncbi:unnamed protein product, partial [Allacma fusca]